jgi:hypothetical protein
MLKKAVTGIIDAMSTINGMHVPSDGMPPESINVFPFAVCFPFNGQTDIEATFAKDIHLLKLLVIESRSTLPHDVNATVELYESVRNALITDPTLGGGVTTIIPGRPALTYQYGQIQYGSNEYLGYEFDIPCKVLG